MEGEVGEGGERGGGIEGMEITVTVEEGRRRRRTKKRRDVNCCSFSFVIQPTGIQLAEQDETWHHLLTWVICM